MRGGLARSLMSDRVVPEGGSEGGPHNHHAADVASSVRPLSFPPPSLSFPSFLPSVSRELYQPHAPNGYACRPPSLPPKSLPSFSLLQLRPRIFVIAFGGVGRARRGGRSPRLSVWQFASSTPLREPHISLRRRSQLLRPPLMPFY